MKIIKTIILFLLVTAGLYLGASFFLPKNYILEKSLTINSPSNLVYEQVLFYENWKNWSPFLNGNNQLTTLASAEDGKVNSYLRWKSKIGNEGRISITKIDELKKIEYLIEIDNPKPKVITGFILFEPELNQTKTTFHFEGSNPLYLRILNLFIERQYEKDLAKTLEMLDKASAKEYEILKNEYFGYKIKEGIFEERKVGYVRKTIEYGELIDFFQSNLKKIKMEAKNCNFKIKGNNLFLFYKPDDVNQVYNVAAAVPIEGDSSLGDDFAIMTLEKHKAVFLNYYGGFYNAKKAEEALYNFARNKKLKPQKPIIRENIKGPEQEPDSNKWHSVIWFFIN